MRTYYKTVGRMIIGVALVLACPLVSPGNNLTINNVTLTNASGGQADIQFDLSWENSWYETWTEAGGTISVTNWDAVWVFAKYRQNGGLWKHVMLTPAGHTATGGTAINVADEGGGKRLGAFVRRTAAGSGTVNCTAMRLHWDLAAAGLPSADDIDITVMGVEMVYIPEGAFFVGSGGTETYHFHAGADESAPFQITSEAEITVGEEPGNLNATGLLADLVPAAFPKGYAAFYCMKYEVSEGQYTDFLNLLDPGIAGNYYATASGSRHTIMEAAGGGYETSAPDRACNYLNDHRLLTYLDWSGLRPMTELEFEKACRGAAQPWVNEYAWGNTNYVPLTGFDGTDGSGTETALPANANCHFAESTYGGVRCGIFAGSASTRESAGATYYGVMEMSGNLWEMVVGLNRAQGRGFTGAYGDGNVYTAYAIQWEPGNSYAYGARGGSVSYYAATHCRLSDRAAIDGRYHGSSHQNGGRGVRSEP